MKDEEDGRKPAGTELAARTKCFARRMIRLYVALPQETVAQVLGRQLLRAGTSIGANYREANRMAALLDEANQLVAIFVSISKRARGD